MERFSGILILLPLLCLVLSYVSATNTGCAYHVADKDVYGKCHLGQSYCSYGCKVSVKRGEGVNSATSAMPILFIAATAVGGTIMYFSWLITTSIFTEMLC